MAPVRAVSERFLEDEQRGCRRHVAVVLEDLPGITQLIAGQPQTFLSDLKNESRSWTKAIGRYHSRHQRRGMKYRLKVLSAWREERRLSGQRHNAAF